MPRITDYSFLFQSMFGMPKKNITDSRRRYKRRFSGFVLLPCFGCQPYPVVLQIVL
ncbi:MAG: hypothetical protein HFI75_02175 [Lachnospiraceae bacterium]|nr:hypothetical protein [Lachnospiraceae bacterium]